MATAEMNYVDGMGGGEISYEVTPTNLATLTLEVGKKYLFLIWGSYNTSHSYTTFDNTTFSNANFNKLANIYPANDYTVGTYFEVEPTSASVTVNQSTGCVITLIYAQQS